MVTNVQVGNFVFNEGDVKSVTEDITANLESITIPTTAPSNTLLYDFDGSINTITLSGNLTDSTTTRVTGETVLTIEAQKAYLKSLINGMQTKRLFYSTYNASGIYVMVASVSFTEEQGNPNILNFTMKLIEGTN